MATWVFPVFVLLLMTLFMLPLTDGLVTPIEMPKNLYDCLDQKTDTSNTSVTPARAIQSFCIAKFIETTTAWSPNLTDPNVINYISSLLRKVVRQAELLENSRQKRQVFGGTPRQEVRAAPYEFNWRRYASAVRRLKNTFGVRPDTNNYDVIAGIHAGRTLDPAHNGPNFLGWHRIYLLIMEQALGASIPYWDSSLDFEMPDPVNTILFTARYFGNGFGFVTAGPFANLPGRPIVRNIGSDGTLISKQAIAAVLSRMRHAEIVEPSDATTVQFSLEAHHNGPHVWVDGTLGSLSSAAYDPIFFCHHAFIDYIWELFRRRIPNAHMDYPPVNIPGHEPFRFMDFGDFPFAPRIRTQTGYADPYARLTMYQPSPVCPNCGNSPDLICNNARGVCVSREAPPEARLQAPAARVTGGLGAAGFGAQSAVVMSADGVEPDTPQRARNAVAQAGPLATGPKFVSPFRDGRVRNDPLPNVPADPSLTRGKRNAMEPGLVVSGQTDNPIARTSGSQDTKLMGENVKDKPYQNSFIINGKSDIRLWAFMSVKVIYMRPPGEDFGSRMILNGQIVNNTDMYDPHLYKSLQEITNDNVPATYARCSPSKPGPDRIFIQSDGINYSGRYKDYAKIDLRQPVSSSFTYIGIKRPTNDSYIEALITAYDTCGRVCRPRCLEYRSQPPVYKPCTGTIMADTQLPLMYGKTYGEAVKSLWRLWESAIQGVQDSSVPVMFMCDHDGSVPWYKTQN